jgi:hypothetical protein
MKWEPESAIRFVLTPTDLVEAFSVQRTVETGMRPWFRIASYAIVCLQFLGTLIFSFMRREKSGPWWALLLMTAFGFYLWRSMVTPIVRARTIRREAPSGQPVTVRCGGEGVDITIEGVHQEHRRWEDVTAVHHARSGILITFQDGLAQWLPVRAFAAPPQAKALVDYIKRRQAP